MNAPRRLLIRADGREQPLNRALTRVECVLLLDADDMRQLDLAPAFPDWLLLFDGAGAGRGRPYNPTASRLAGTIAIHGDALVLPAGDFNT